MSSSLFLNSLFVGIGATALAGAAGLIVAIAAATSSPSVRRAWLLLALLNLALPPFLVANAWLDLTATWRSLASASTVATASLPITALSLAALLWPITCLLILGGWTKVQAEQLEADPLARGTWLLRNLLLPAARPEAVVALALTLVLALANFTVPTLFQVRVFTEEFWIRFNTQFDLRGALQAAWPLLATPLLLLLFLRGRSVSWPRRESPVPPRLLRRQLGPLSMAAWILGVGWLGLSLGFPLARLLLAERTWTELAGAVAAGRSAIEVSALTAAGTATLTTLLGLAISGYPRLRLAISGAWLLFLVPGVFLGVVLIAALNRPWSAAVYQSLGIIFLALTLRYLAPGASMVRATVKSADTSLIDVARAFGGNRWQVWRFALLPQSAAGLAAAWYAVYLLCLWDVETVVLIQPPGGETLALRIFNLLHYGHAGQVNALCVVMLALAAAPALGWLIARPTARWFRGSPSLGDGEGDHPGRPRISLRDSREGRIAMARSAVARSFAGAWGSGERPRAGALPAPRPSPERKPFGLGRTGLALIPLLIGLAGCSPRSSESSTRLDSKLFSRVEVIGGRGVAPGQFNKPRSVQCDREDNLYVADLTGRIQKFSPDGKFLRQWQMPQTDLGKPKGMTVDRDGDVVVIEPHYMRVNHFSPDGALIAQWGRKGTNAGEFILPRAIVQNSHGEYYISEYTVVDRVQRFGAAAKSNGLVAPPGSIESGASPQKRPNESLLTAWGKPGTAPGEFNRAEGLGLGPRDEVFVADSCNHRIQVFDREGKFLRAYGQPGSNPGDFSYPYDIRVDANGQQFICEFGNSRITALDAHDRVIEVIGGAGAGPGQFANPWAIALDSRGNLYVADSQNHRVQKLIRKPLKH